MKALLARIIASLLPSGAPLSAPRGVAQAAHDGMSRSDVCWEEALMCAAYDDNARMFLDHFGPRWK